MNTEELRAKVQERVKALADSADGKLGPLSQEIINDIELGLFLCVVTDFISEVPTAEVNNVEILDAATGHVRLALPIPRIFEQYFEMRISKIKSGEPITPSDAIAVVSGAPNDRPL